MILVLFFIGCCGPTGSNVSNPTSQPITPSRSASTATPIPTITPIPEPSPISLSGTGQTATQKFRLEKGLSIFEMKHFGSSNFAIWLMNSQGQKEELLVNEIGDFDGSKAYGIEKAGDYLLDISADGPWSVTIKQPRPINADPVPLTLTGQGQKATKIFYLNKGLARFEMKHDGSSNFAIWLMNSQGEKEELLVNEIGTFDGSKAVGISRAGGYILDIAADGNWEVKVS